MGWANFKYAWRLIYDSGDTLVDHDGIEHAGYLSFVLLLAFCPFLVFFVAILGALGETDMGAHFIRMILDNAPQDIIGAIIPRINEILSGPPAGLLTISILGTIWTASSLIEGYRAILNRAYHVKTPPNYYARRALSILQLIILVALLIVAMFILVFLPAMAAKVYGLFDGVNNAAQMTTGTVVFEYEQMSFLGVEWENLRYIIVIAVMFLFISALYYWLPNLKQSWIRTFPGAVVAVMGWLLAGRAFSYYLSNFGQMNLVYGSLGGLIAFLLFFYFLNIIFIYGAEFNYLLEKSMGLKFEEKEEVRPNNKIEAPTYHDDAAPKKKRSYARRKKQTK
jgi:membrane protein